MFFRPAKDGLDLFVRLTPRGGEDALEGVEDTADGRPILRGGGRAAPYTGGAKAAV